MELLGHITQTALLGCIAPVSLAADLQEEVVLI